MFALCNTFIKDKICWLKTTYNSIDKQASNSFSFPFLLSFVVFIFSTTISLIISEEINDIQEALPVYCSSLFSTVITFCLTTTIQNFFELKYTSRNMKDRSAKFNIISFFYSVIYMFIYFIYLLETSVFFGILFLIISSIAIILSALAFIETYHIDDNSVSGTE